MYNKVTQTVEDADFCSAMKTATIQRSGASPKSRTSRNNLKFGIFFLIIGLIMFSCEKHDDNENPEKAEINGKIELPSNLSPDDIKIFEAGGSNIEVNSDGTFNSNSNQIIAADKEGRIVYFSYNSFDTLAYRGGSVLSKQETALSILMHYIPNMFEPISEEQVKAFKQLVLQLPETQTLISAVGKSVENRGYLETADFENELDAAATAIYKKSGISNLLSAATVKASQTLRSGSPEYSVRNNGFRLDLMQSTYDERLQIWHCNFTAYSEWGCYLSVIPAVMDNGQAYILNADLLRYIVPPANVSKFKSGLTSWQTQWQYWTEVTKSIFSKEFDTDDWTWDNSKLENINITFVAPQDVVFIPSPMQHPYLLAYNLTWLTAKPVIKMLFGNLKGSEWENQFIDGFCEKFATDDVFLQKLHYERPDWNDIATYHLAKFRDYTISYSLTKLFPYIITDVLKEEALKTALGLIGQIEKWVVIAGDATLMGASFMKFQPIVIDPQL